MDRRHGQLQKNGNVAGSLRAEGKLLLRRWHWRPISPSIRRRNYRFIRLVRLEKPFGAIGAQKSGPEKPPRTREDWWRAWRRMKPIFADIDPRTITLEDISAWGKMIEDTVSLREAHRALKTWRALWKVCAALDYCIRGADPSLGVRNSAAKGRSEIWAEGEVVRLFKQAWRDRYFGLAALIAVAWSTQLSPGDVRTLKASQLVRRQNGVAFFAERSKTGKPVGGELNDRALAAMEAYLGELGIELHGESYIFRTRTGVPYSKDTLGDDFRAIRSAVFGERERRTLADFRRS